MVYYDNRTFSRDKKLKWYIVSFIQYKSNNVFNAYFLLDYLCYFRKIFVYFLFKRFEPGLQLI